MTPVEGARGTPEDGSTASRGRDSRAPLLGAVLAGGESRRFGRDKTVEPVGGMPMVERAVQALEPACTEVVVVSSRPGTPTGRWRVVPDLRPGEGPLAGIEAGLAEAGTLGLGGAVVLAADLPLVDAGTVARLVEALEADDEAVAAAREPEGDGPSFEPLCAVYRVGCREVVAGLLDEGRRDARALFQAVDGRHVDIAGGATLNVNTPEALGEAESALAEADSTLAAAEVASGEGRPEQGEAAMGDRAPGDRG